MVLHVVPWYCTLCHGAARCGMVLHIVARCCTLWQGAARCGMVLHDAGCRCMDAARCGMVLYVAAWCCTFWQGTVMQSCVLTVHLYFSLQVIMRWFVQCIVIPIPKTVTVKHTRKHRCIWLPTNDSWNGRNWRSTKTCVLSHMETS